MFSGRNFQRVCSQTMALVLLSSFSLIYNKNSEQKVEEKDKKNVKTSEEKNGCTLSCRQGDRKS